MKEPIGFKDACRLIGGSLRDDFSEIDSENQEDQVPTTDVSLNSINRFL